MRQQIIEMVCDLPVKDWDDNYSIEINKKKITLFSAPQQRTRIIIDEISFWDDSDKTEKLRERLKLHYDIKFGQILENTIVEIHTSLFEKK
ncbi:MAG: hypothetical protein AABY22_10720 [Nanoarchaeota archaeon]